MSSFDVVTPRRDVLDGELTEARFAASLEAAREKRRRYEEQLAALQQRQSSENLRQRFTSLVRETVAAGCARLPAGRRRHGVSWPRD